MRVRWLVSGEVQGVGFRVFVWRAAQALKVKGIVRNMADGRVEVIAEGDPNQLASLEGAIGRGPRSARVANVEKAVISDELTEYKTFDIR